VYQGTTITVIRSKERRTFGACTTKGFTSSGGYVNDNASWLFSLDQSLKLPAIAGNSHHVYHHPSYMPTFGSNHDLRTWHTSFFDTHK